VQVSLVVGDYFGDLIPWTENGLAGFESLVVAMLRKMREQPGLPALSNPKMDSSLHIAVF
jgi:hypothetical protein